MLVLTKVSPPPLVSVQYRFALLAAEIVDVAMFGWSLTVVFAVNVPSTVMLVKLSDTGV
jgi:hypothetical protein